MFFNILQNLDFERNAWFAVFWFFPTRKKPKNRKPCGFHGLRFSGFLPYPKNQKTANRTLPGISCSLRFLGFFPMAKTKKLQTLPKVRFAVFWFFPKLGKLENQKTQSCHCKVRFLGFWFFPQTRKPAPSVS